MPFIIADNGSIPKGEVDTTTLINTGLDILATCCDYAGIAAPDDCLGVSVRPAAEGWADAKAGTARTYVASENDHGRMIRTSRYKYTVYAGSEEREILTDLVADPGELHNLATEDPGSDLLAQYRTLMREWFEKSGDHEGLSDFVVS